MGRRVSSGVLPGGTGFTFFQDNTLSSAELNANLRLTANGTGTIEMLKDTALTGNLTVNAEGEVRLADAAGGQYVAFKSPETVATSYTITLPDASPTRDGVVFTANIDGTTSWEPAKSFDYSVQNSSFAAVAFGGYFVDTSGGGVTATLPSSPSTGDTVRFVDVASSFDSFTFTVNRNGQPIMGDAANLTVELENAAFELVYSNSTFGWRLFSV